MEFRLLGPLEVIENGRVLELGGAKQRALLAVLLLHRGAVVPTDRLIDELWGERPPQTAQKTVQVYISRLRKVLGEEVLLTRSPGYMFATESARLDIEQFESLIAEGRRALQQSDPETAAARLGEGLALWRGPALADFTYESFAKSEIARLQESRLDAIEDRVDAELELGRHRDQVAELRSLLRANPNRERLLGQLMLALYRCGRQAEALEAYRRGRRALSEELGLQPGPELRALEQRILEHDPALEKRAAPARLAQAVAPAGEIDGGGPMRRRALIAAGGALLLLAAVLAIVAELGGGGGLTVRVAPNSLAAIDTRTNRVDGAVPVGARPDGVAFGSGSLWVANLDDRSISEVDPATLQTLHTISVSDPPTGIAAAGGAVWVVNPSPVKQSVSLNRIDPAFDVIHQTAQIGNVVPGSTATISAHGDSLWVAPFSGELTRLDSNGRHVLDELDPNGGPTAIAAGADGVWMTDSEADNVIHVDSSGLLSSLPVGHGPSGIAFGDGGVWVSDTGDDTLVRLDPESGAVTATIPVGAAPLGVALGAGSVWVANSGDGTVTRVDPISNRVIATIAVGGSPQQVTVATGRAWVTIDARTLSSSGVAGAGGTARLDAAEDVSSMDPALADDSLSWQLLYATCAKLLNYPDKAGQAASRLVPEVAQSLPAVSDGGKTYTFTIRPGFRFSPPSNQPVTAETFKDTIERSLNPRMHSPQAGEFRDIVGADAYMAGRAAHVAGVSVHANKLTIRLTAPAPDLPARTTEPALCAVPPDAPIDPLGVRVIPSAGPYRVTSYTPGQGIVLTRNPDYRGDRPHRLARIEVAVGIPAKRAVADVLEGTADYAVNGEVTATDAATLAARYGPASAAAKHGHEQYFVNAEAELDFLALNTHRPLFANLALRQAVNYAIGRAALARLGNASSRLPDDPTDHYLPPGDAGYSKGHFLPFTPNLAKARALAAGHAGDTAVLYTCDVAPCAERAQLIKTELAAIGLRLEVRSFPIATLYSKLATPGAPFDIASVGWGPSDLDPDAMLNALLESGTVIPTFIDPAYRARLAAAAQLTGAVRYLTYARLDAELARNAAPWIAYGNASSHDLFSARMGCQVYGEYGIDLAALCVRKGSR